jgi:hypothetical protein
VFVAFLSTVWATVITSLDDFVVFFVPRNLLSNGEISLASVRLAIVFKCLHGHYLCCVIVSYIRIIVYFTLKVKPKS